MNLQEAMLSKLHEATERVVREQSMMPQGLQTMSHEQSPLIFSRLRGTSPSRSLFSKPRPMSSSDGQAILDRLNNR